MPPQLEQEVKRRQRLGQESAARRDLISSSYSAARPEIYSSLQVPGGGAGYWEEEAGRVCVCRVRAFACSTAGVFCPQDEALAPEFLAAVEYSTSPGADLRGLLQRLETVSGEVGPRDLAGLGDERLDLSNHVCLQKPNLQELESIEAGRLDSFAHLPSSYSVPCVSMSQHG